MGFFSNILQAAKRKQEEMKNRREFLDMVDEKAKPIRRQFYMKQMLQEAIKEGREKAKLDAAKRIPQKKKTPSDFGLQEEKAPKETTLMEGINNPMKFMDAPSQFKSKRKKK